MNTLNTNEVHGDEAAIEENFAAIGNQQPCFPLPPATPETNGALLKIMGELAGYITSLEARIVTLERTKPAEPGDLMKAIDTTLQQSEWFGALVKSNVEEMLADLDLSSMVEDKVQDYMRNEFDPADELETAIGNYDFDDKLETAINSYDFTDKVEEIVGGMDIDDKIEKAMDSYDFSVDISRAVDDYDFQPILKEATLRITF